MNDTLEDRGVLLKAEDVPPGMCIDELDVAPGCKLDLGLQAADVILAGLALRQDLPDQFQPKGGMQVCNLLR
ncbi:MAG: hypothetical protein ACM3XO_20825 [Bacteroidota bacterium]